MRRWSSVAGVALVIVTVTGCKSYQRNRRPRASVPAAPIEARDDESPRPPPRPTQAPPKPAPKPAPREDRSGCGPGKGPRFAVHGVDPADTLNVRVAPDAKSDVLGQLLPTTTGVLAVGDQRKVVGASTWRKVRCGALVGWVNERFLDPQESAEGASGKRM
jgi:hypothetical protein